MSITDELRDWARGLFNTRETVLAIADRIDTEHQKALDEWKAEHGQMWLKGYSECHAELLEGNETLASDLEKCGWIRLPKDADGEYIHIGDVMEGEKIGGGFCEPFEVVGYIMSNGELEPMDEHKCPRKRKYSHHHKQPTVEDVLQELEGMRGNNADYEDVVIRCAELAKILRELLAGEGE